MPKKKINVDKKLLEKITTVGGFRENGGAKKLRTTIVAEKAAEESKVLGIKPHEWLLKVANGDGIKHFFWELEYNKQGKEIGRKLREELVYADFPTRVDAAKAAAPFYAAKLVMKTVSQKGGDTDVVADALKEIAKQLPV